MAELASGSYADQIVHALTGAAPHEAQEWDGPSKVLSLYDSAAGPDRDAVIRAIGKIIDDADQPAPVLAELVLIASSLDIAQVEPNVQKLAASPLGEDASVRKAINNYLAFRQIAQHGGVFQSESSHG